MQRTDQGDVRLVVPPAATVKIVQGHAAPFYVRRHYAVEDLHVHYRRGGLLDAANASQVHAFAKAGNNVILGAEVAQVATRIHARKNEENEHRAAHGEDRQQHCHQ